MSIDPNKWLLGSGVPSAKFDTIGKTVAGRITEQPEVRQQTDFDTGGPKTWDNGDPMMQLVVTLATDERDPDIEDDDGTRRLYVKGNMQQAVAAAVRGARSKLEIGGRLSVTYTGDDEPKKRGMSGAKRYTASYTPAADAFLEEENQQEQSPGNGHSPAATELQKAAQSVATSDQPAAGVDPALLQAALSNLPPEVRKTLGIPA